MNKILLNEDDYLARLIAENPQLIDQCLETLDAINSRYNDECYGTAI